MAVQCHMKSNAPINKKLQTGAFLGLTLKGSGQPDICVNLNITLTEHEKKSKFVKHFVSYL